MLTSAARFDLTRKCKKRRRAVSPPRYGLDGKEDNRASSSLPIQEQPEQMPMFYPDPQSPDNLNEQQAAQAKALDTESLHTVSNELQQTLGSTVGANEGSSQVVKVDPNDFGSQPMPDAMKESMDAVFAIAKSSVTQTASALTNAPRETEAGQNAIQTYYKVFETSLTKPLKEMLNGIGEIMFDVISPEEHEAALQLAPYIKFKNFRKADLFDYNTYMRAFQNLYRAISMMPEGRTRRRIKKQNIKYMEDVFNEIKREIQNVDADGWNNFLTMLKAYDGATNEAEAEHKLIKGIIDLENYLESVMGNFRTTTAAAGSLIDRLTGSTTELLKKQREHIAKIMTIRNQLYGDRPSVPNLSRLPPDVRQFVTDATQKLQRLPIEDKSQKTALEQTALQQTTKDSMGQIQAYLQESTNEKTTLRRPMEDLINASMVAHMLAQLKMFARPGSDPNELWSGRQTTAQMVEGSKEALQQASQTLIQRGQEFGRQYGQEIGGAMVSVMTSGTSSAQPDTVPNHLARQFRELQQQLQNMPERIGTEFNIVEAEPASPFGFHDIIANLVGWYVGLFMQLYTLLVSLGVSSSFALLIAVVAGVGTTWTIFSKFPRLCITMLLRLFRAVFVGLPLRMLHGTLRMLFGVRTRETGRRTRGAALPQQRGQPANLQVLVSEFVDELVEDISRRAPTRRLAAARIGFDTKHPRVFIGKARRTLPRDVLNQLGEENLRRAVIQRLEVWQHFLQQM